MKKKDIIYTILLIIVINFAYILTYKQDKILLERNKQNKIEHVYNKYYEYNIVNNDTIAIDTIYIKIK